MPRAKKGHRKDGRVQIKRVIGHNWDGTPINKWFSGKDKNEALQNYYAFLNEWEKKQAEKKQMPFENWADEWLYTYKQPDVRPVSFDTTYYRPVTLHILPYFKGKIIQDITQADIKRFGNSIKHLSQSLIDKIMLCLYGIFETAVDNDIVIKNPCRNIKIKSTKEKQKKRTYDKETTDLLCSIEHTHAIFVSIILSLGLRASEVCGLKWADIKQNQIYVRQAITEARGVKYINKPKSTNSIRKLPVSDKLMEQINKVPKTGDFVFPGLSPKKIHQRIDTFYGKLGIPKELRLSPHELRHTCGTLLYEETKDIYYVSRYLGHSDISITTKIYVHSELQEDKISLTHLLTHF